jgi:MarR family transcriptional regulator, lower aerobic nicotinate degradation pathway regulator
MPNKSEDIRHDSIGAWAKRCYFAGRALMEDALRPHDLGSSQWYVLYQLAQEGPTMQRDLLRLLQVERATLSVIIGSLVRKELVEQIPDTSDQRQKRLRMTPAGARLWEQLPDLTFIRKAAFEGFNDADIATTIRVLRTATERLDALSRKENDL